jgi:hypothetical protein
LLVDGAGTDRLQGCAAASIEIFLVLQLDGECRFDDRRPDHGRLDPEMGNQPESGSSV